MFTHATVSIRGYAEEVWRLPAGSDVAVKLNLTLSFQREAISERTTKTVAYKLGIR